MSIQTERGAAEGPAAGRPISRWYRQVAPEVVATASDNDPTNIGTAAAVGAGTGYHLAWAAVLVAPMLMIVQSIALAVATTAGADLQTLARGRYGRGTSGVLLVAILSANLVTLAADLQAGASSVNLLLGIPVRLVVVILATGVLAVLVLERHEQLVGSLRYLVLGLLLFAPAAVMAHPTWPAVLRGSAVPDVSATPGQLVDLAAIIGTTLTSYVVVWETIGRGSYAAAGRTVTARRAHAGVAVGAVFTSLVLWCILVASAATLDRGHVRVTSVVAAAQALRPIAGAWASRVLAVGVLGSALVALPVIVASTGHVVGAHCRWSGMRDRGGRPEWRGVAAMALALLLAVGVSETGVAVVTVLVVASVVGALGSPVALAVLVLLARDRAVMGDRLISRRLAAAGWAVTGLVLAVGLALAVVAGVRA